jgi:cytochrome P450
MGGVYEISSYHPMVRPFFAPFLPKVRRALGYNSFAGKLLEPQINAFKSERQKSNIRKKIVVEDGNGQYHMLHWIMNRIENVEEASPQLLGRSQMSVAFAAIHTTSMTAYNAILDLAANPQYILELRKEIEDVIEEEGKGVLVKTSMPKLKKLDSFLRESQRFHALNASK